MDPSTNIMALTVQKLDMETDAAMFIQQRGWSAV